MKKIIKVAVDSLKNTWHFAISFFVVLSYNTIFFVMHVQNIKCITCLYSLSVSCKVGTYIDPLWSIVYVYKEHCGWL